MSLAESGSSPDWLRYARSDLILAESNPPAGVLLEALCFHAQQAAEKAIKGVMIHVGVEPPFIHDINRLLNILAPTLSFPEAVSASAGLTPYAAISRYPGDVVVIGATEWQEAVALARAVVEWAESVIEGPGAV